jgi:hypothetical protein
MAKAVNDGVKLDIEIAIVRYKLMLEHFWLI